MCGRAAVTISADRARQVAGGGVAARARIRGSMRWRKKYNLGPQTFVPVVQHTELCRTTQGAVVRDVCAMKWGLVPSFAKREEDYDAFKGGMSTFNARIEGIGASNVWRRLLDSNRGVIVFDGFYEWKTTNKGKVPMFVRNCDTYTGDSIPLRKGDATSTLLLVSNSDAPTNDTVESGEPSGPTQAPLLLAALCDVWKGSKGPGQSDEDLDSATMITMDSMGTPIELVHDRMPIFLTTETAALWLDPTVKFTDIVDTLVQASKVHAQTQLHVYEVSPLVSNVRNESPDCLLPKKAYDSKQLAQGLGRFFKKTVNTAASTPAVSENSSTQSCAKRKAAADGNEFDAKIILIDID